MPYAGFWPRAIACIIDDLILVPLFLLTHWGQEHFRLFDFYFFVPDTAFMLFYNVYLVRKFGGTPGKRMIRLRITKVDGQPISYREACLRYLPGWILNMATSAALVIAVVHLTDAEYFAATSFFERTKLVQSFAPSWYGPIKIAISIFACAELIAMLANKKRRALHDFLAGTVVVEDAVETSVALASETR